MKNYKVNIFDLEAAAKYAFENNPYKPFQSLDDSKASILDDINKITSVEDLVNLSQYGWNLRKEDNLIRVTVSPSFDASYLVSTDKLDWF